MSDYSEGYQDGLKTALNFIELAADFEPVPSELIEAIKHLITNKDTK